MGNNFRKFNKFPSFLSGQSGKRIQDHPDIELPDDEDIKKGV
jgi:hypothetical protein